MLRGKRLVALTGAGCSTESGIPDYRGAGKPPRARASIDLRTASGGAARPAFAGLAIQHREFVDKAENRRRYWARSLLGWPRLAAAKPNDGHRALAVLEGAGVVGGLITQNVDGLHGAAGSRAVVELHGALARVRCLACARPITRDDLQQRLLAANPGFGARAQEVAIAPDGDAELPDDLVADFVVVPCDACGGVLMPDVVFFGGSVPRPTLDAAWEAFDRADALLVVGSSLTVFSGYRFVRRAAERGMPIAIINRGPTRGDPHATLLVDAQAGQALPALARALA